MQTKHFGIFILLGFILVILLFLNIILGSISIPYKEVFLKLLGFQTSNETWDYIVLNYRLPKALTAILVGIGLSISGLLMQTLFKNPLAGPYVLGLSSGSSLGVAFIILGAELLPYSFSNLIFSSIGIILASTLGSFFVLICVLFISQKLRNTTSILIIGLMFSSFSFAIISVLTYFSTAEELQKFTFWGMGSLENLSWDYIIILTIAVLIGLMISFLNIKSLNSMLLGDNYARSLGLNLKRSRLSLIIATSVLSGSVTAFVGPIAFVGLAVPHISKLVFQTSDHKFLFWATIFIGAITMLICDTLSHLLSTDAILPINAITSLIGAPIVIWLIVRKNGFI